MKLARKGALFFVILLLFAFISNISEASVIKGVIRNDDDPWIVESEDGDFYSCEWYGGVMFFSEGDEVILTRDFGFCEMISLNSRDTAKVYVDEM